MRACEGYNAKGQRCKRAAGESGFCAFHDPDRDPKAQELAKRAADGTLGDQRPKRTDARVWAGEPWVASAPAPPRIARGGTLGPGSRGLRHGPRRV